MATSMPYPAQANDRQTPQPPTLHWAIVLVLDLVTFTLFGYYWAFRQASFVRKIDSTNPQSKRATMQVLVSLALALFAGLMNAMNTMTISRGGVGTDLSTVMNMVHLFQFALFTVASVVVRNALVARFGVKMNLALTIFFNIFYVQYHLTRIAKLQLPLIAPGIMSIPVAQQTAPTR